MPASPAGISYLVERYVAGDCSAEELEQFFNAAASDEHRDEITAALASLWHTGNIADISWLDKNLVFERVQQHVTEEIPFIPTARHRGVYKVIGWAAAVIITLGTALYYFSDKTEKPRNSLTASAKEILPGADKVKLTLPDGREILLDNSGSVVAGESNIKTENSQLLYSANPAPSLHTVTTPKGKTFSVRLSDGSIAWLNATSSIAYPTLFTGDRRSIKITGEAYLEVAPAKTPFVINVDDRSDITVLGTEININAYMDEPAIKTTLLTGAVRVENNNKSLVLKPGQQAQLSKAGTITVINNANTEQVTAWKNGIFDFEGTGTREVFRELSRWYEIDVEYKGHVPERNFNGQIGRDLNLSQVLNGLRGMDLHFSLNGNKLTITE